MSNPTVDILMATYNGERFVGEQIESIQRQTYRNWRLLVSDDCSTDGTLDVVRPYAAEDQRISVVSEGVRHGGAKENFFALMEFSTAPFFMFCDQDDVWLPGKVESEVQALADTDPAVPTAVYTDMRVVDNDLHEIAPSFLDQERNRDIQGDLKRMLSISCVAGCTMFGNAALRDLVNGTDCSDALMHDWWLAIIASSCGGMLYLDESTVLYRQHGDNEVGAESYSFTDRVAHYGQSRRRYWLSCVQARSILRNYGHAMRDDSRRTVEVYVSQLSGGFMRTVRTMSDRGLLKEGRGRRAGQILTLLLGVPAELKAE